MRLGFGRGYEINSSRGIRRTKWAAAPWGRGSVATGLPSPETSPPTGRGSRPGSRPRPPLPRGSGGTGEAFIQALRRWVESSPACQVSRVAAPTSSTRTFKSRFLPRLLLARRRAVCCHLRSTMTPGGSLPEPTTSALSSPVPLAARRAGLPQSQSAELDRSEQALLQPARSAAHRVMVDGRALRRNG